MREKNTRTSAREKSEQQASRRRQQHGERKQGRVVKTTKVNLYDEYIEDMYNSCFRKSRRSARLQRAPEYTRYTESDRLQRIEDRY